MHEVREETCNMPDLPVSLFILHSIFLLFIGFFNLFNTFFNFQKYPFSNFLVIALRFLGETDPYHF